MACGIDASLDGLREASTKAAKKAAKGGVANALFICAAIEALPAELCAFAEIVTVHYPWGSLLTAVLQPESLAFRKIVGLLKPGAELQMLINLTVLEDRDYCARLGVPLVDNDMLAKLKSAFLDQGLHKITIDPIEQSPVISTWGNRLTKASKRRVLQVTAIRCSAP